MSKKIIKVQEFSEWEMSQGAFESWQRRILGVEIIEVKVITYLHPTNKFLVTYRVDDTKEGDK